MDKAIALSKLRPHENALRSLGVQQLSIFGSTARDEARPDSDVDLSASFVPEARVGFFKFAEIADQLETILGVPVDLVGEPARKTRIQGEIDRDRVRVF